MEPTLSQAFKTNFLGNSPGWYEKSIIAFLVLNPFILYFTSPFIMGWVLIAEFIFTLAMALKCYPLQPGGLLALQAIMMGMATPEAVYNETVGNFQVIMLLMFMVAGIYFMRDMLLYTFTKILLGVRSKTLLSFLFCFAGAVLSAFLDALTVTAVLITVSVGFYSVYHKVASGKRGANSAHNHTNDDNIKANQVENLEQFRAFLRSLIMHGEVGTALGGVTTLVGEPQTLLIAEKAGWEFMEFFLRMAPVTLPVFACGLICCVLLEKAKILGYGAEIPEDVLAILKKSSEESEKNRSQQDNAALITQAVVAGILVIALALHLAPVGLIGLMIIVLLTAFNGVTEEHQIGKAFEEALPFTALLVVFFAIVAVIHEQHLFSPVIEWVLAMEPASQPGVFFLANGLLSAISDNVFVATVYINEVKMALESGLIDRPQFDKLVIAINTGTNLPSVATPNGQAAFLFLLTSALAPLIKLSYMRMVLMALPYTIVLTVVGLLGVLYNI